jgi:response regulator of citrate/malate metabolism
MIKLFKNNKKTDLTENVSKQLGIQYVQIFKILERIQELSEKVDKNQKLLRRINKRYSKKHESLTIKKRTKAAIRLILKKHGKMTSNDLSKVIHLSRTRCSEYLKELQEEKIVESETVNRKKFFKLRK